MESKPGVTVICDRRKKLFRLAFEEYPLQKGHANIVISGCESGGVYGATVTCPHCQNDHQL